MALIATVWVLTVLVPIHGALFLGIRRERERNRKVLLGLWRLHSRK